MTLKKALLGSLHYNSRGLIPYNLLMAKGKRRRKRTRGLVRSERPRLFTATAMAFVTIVTAAGFLMIHSTLAGMEPIGVPGNWNLVFDDEFNGSSLDTSVWSPDWFGRTGNMNNVTTSPSNVSVSGGDLNLTLSSSGVGALVSSNPAGGASKGVQFATGYYAEARIYFPGSGSRIYNWPAFWTDGQHWPADGEIDIAEGLGQLTSNYHSPLGSNNGPFEGSGWADGWHTYGVDREPGKNTIYWDGKVIRTYSTDDSGAPEYLILNVGCASRCVTGPASEVKVDYVRVWSNASANTPAPSPTPATPAPTVSATPSAAPVSGASGSAGAATPEQAPQGSSPTTPILYGNPDSASTVSLIPASPTVDMSRPLNVSGTIEMPVPFGSSKTVVRTDYATVGNNATINTRYLSNGPHVVSVETTVNGNTSMSTYALMVNNKLNPLEQVRNAVFASYHGDASAINGTMLAILLLILAGASWPLRKLYNVWQEKPRASKWPG